MPLTKCIWWLRVCVLVKELLSCQGSNLKSPESKSGVQPITPQDIVVPGAGLEPARPQWATDFLTTIVFTTISVCGLDFLLTLVHTLGFFPSSLYTFLKCLLTFKTSLGISILKPSPNLRSSTLSVSA